LYNIWLGHKDNKSGLYNFRTEYLAELRRRRRQRIAGEGRCVAGHRGERSGEGAQPPPQKNFSIMDLK